MFIIVSLFILSRPPKWALSIPWGHDFLLLRTERRESDGTILVLSRSVVHKDCPVGKGYHRDEADISGFIIRPCGATSSVLIYVTQVKMFNIPEYFEKKFLNNRPMMIANIRKFVEKELKDKTKLPAWRHEQYKNGSFQPGPLG